MIDRAIGAEGRPTFRHSLLSAWGADDFVAPDEAFIPVEDPWSPWDGRPLAEARPATRDAALAAEGSADPWAEAELFEPASVDPAGVEEALSGLPSFDPALK